MRSRAEQMAERIVSLVAAKGGSVPWDTLEPHERAAVSDAVAEVLGDNLTDVDTAPPAVPRRFILRRHDDETGMSGTGDVAEGIVFTDGSAAMRWCTEITSTAIYPSLQALELIHGHGGRTRIVMVDA